MESILVRLDNVIEYCQILFVTIGVTFALVLSVGVFRRVYEAVSAFLIPKIRPQNLKNFGEWAILTGGSSGICKSYAQELAKLGMNIIVVSNELEALQRTVDEIKSEYGVECCYVHIDFIRDEKIYDYLETQLERKNIGVFVNGAGIFGNGPCYFLKESENNILNMIDLHIKAIVHLTRKVHDLMARRNKGIIVNISSLSSSAPFPFIGTYSACKAFSDHFTRSIIAECSKTGVSFQSLVPFFVHTGMIENVPYFHIQSTFVPSVNTFCKYAVATLGVTEWTTGYWMHGLIWFCTELTPIYLLNFIMKLIMKRRETEKLQ